MLDLLFEYVDLSMTTLCPEKGKMEELEAYYQVKTPLYTHITVESLKFVGVNFHGLLNYTCSWGCNFVYSHT